jgi:hypothetical protein
MSFDPKYDPHTHQRNKLPKELWEPLYKIIFDSGYLCYHDDVGCYQVLSEIIDLLHKFRIEK